MSRTLFALLLLVCALAAEPAVIDPPLVSVEGLPLALRAADAPSCAGGTFSLAEMTGDGRIDITCALTVFPNLGGGTFGSPMTRTFTDGIDRSYVLDANLVVDAREQRRSAALLRGDGEGV